MSAADGILYGLWVAMLGLFVWAFLRKQRAELELMARRDALIERGIGEIRRLCDELAKKREREERSGHHG